MDDAATVLIIIVAVVTARVGRWAGVIAAVASALLYNVFIREPFGEISLPPDVREYLLWACFIAMVVLLRPIISSERERQRSEREDR